MQASVKLGREPGADLLAKVDFDPSHAYAWLIPDSPGIAPDDAPWAMLDTAELSRALALRDPASRRLYVTSHAWLRQILSAATGRQPASLVIDRRKGGKPFLRQPQGEPRLHFSLSHTKGCAAIAICWLCEVGVDIERVEALHDLDTFLPLVTNDDERRCLDGMDQEKRLANFFALWTAKEAYVKAAGCGLVQSFPGIRFEPRCFPGMPVRAIADACGLPRAQVRSELISIGKDREKGRFALSVSALGMQVPWNIRILG